MDRYISLLGTLAWPVSTLVIAVILRKDLGRALGRVGQFKYRDLEVTFRDDLRQAEALIGSIAPSTSSKGSIVLEVGPCEPTPLVGHLIGDVTSYEPPTEVGEGLAKQADRSPREAVEAAWGVVGKALVRAASSVGDRRITGLTNPEAAARFLIDRRWLSGPEAQLVGLLRNLRDRASRPDQAPPSPEDARRFIDLALQVAARIEDHG